MSVEADEGTLKLIVVLGVRRRSRLLVVQYEVAPNPDKTGWWIPAHELAWGGDPYALAAAEVDGLGYARAAPRLMDVESFTLDQGHWHVITHYVLDVESDPVPGPNIREWRWCDALDLPDAASFAHKRWEVDVARRMLAFEMPRPAVVQA
jgi:hypothetical protein